MTDGVLPNPSTNLQVTAGTGMNVTIQPGFGIVRGCMKLEETTRTMAVQAAEDQDRIDTVVLRLNDNDDVRTCDFYVRKGTKATSPTRPQLERTSSIWELGLADLYISKNTSTIASARITDTRMESARCGIISAIAEFDTTTIYNQVQADLREFKANEEDAFSEWFSHIQDILDKDTAGHLQNEINKLTPTDLTKTLSRGQTQLTFVNEKINDNALFDVYTDVFGVIPESMSVSGNTLTITFDAQDVAVSVKVLVREVI